MFVIEKIFILAIVNTIKIVISKSSFYQFMKAFTYKVSFFYNKYNIELA